MKGLWSLPTRTIDPGLATTVFDAIVAVVVSSLTCFSIIRRSKHWPEAGILLVGLLFLSIWFILHWIDMMVHHFQVRVMYSYILVGPVFGTFKVFSDVFILWGVWRVLIRYKHLRPTMEETDSLFLTVTAGGLLWVLAFYQYCLLFALSFAWLSFSDLGVINAIAKGRSSFDVAFTAVQFCSTIGTVLWAALCAEKSSLGWRTEEGGRPDYEKEKYFMACASVCLLLRSFCEVIIVGQLDRWPVSIQRIARARDVTYGFFSMLFCFMVMLAIPQKSADSDRLIQRHEVAVREVNVWIKSHLEQVTEGGVKTAPTVLSLLETLETNLGEQNRSKEPYGVWRIKKKEIKRLKALYGDWEPVYKWQGEGYNSGQGK